MAAPALPSFLRQSNKDNPQSISQSTSSSPPFFSGSGALVRAFVRDHHLDQEEMEMKKIACAVLVAASATVALAADAPAPAPGAAAAGSAAAAVPAVGAVLGATVLSFFAYYLQ
ncbi:hypothetical protein D1007_00579 [Hordeum vulgare]|uniref:Uncharacterized protein n=2 Tax=Hordeum vulgare subsp. vulgare TaxID=112509 RepID=A0A8I7BHC4_HORVV|nr:arabinogalactan protein 23-like [Hordeum vulgare subsp. vulgare]KAE8821432.1 hypothetical protein D1007_00579 [Hordeum vulgare]KAI4981543.1 hypothetical protein ZWY2020_022035 [Hordeum vulgare]